MHLSNGGPPLEIDIELTDPQFELVTTTAQFPAFVGGFGSGKTGALIKRLLTKKFEFPELNVGYYLPTYDLVRTIAFPRFEEALSEMGLQGGGRRPDYVILKADKMLNIRGAGSVILRTMDNPGRIVGYEVADSGIDELDTLKQKDAEDVWRKIMARNRQKKVRPLLNANGHPVIGLDGKVVTYEIPNTIAVGTTPEGFKFVYDRWEKAPPSADYKLIRASTYSNARNLPSDYIPNLRKDYPDTLIDAYIEGLFTNLTSGSVYPQFDRKLNASFETIQVGDALHIGMDFNVGKMSAVVFVYRNGEPHAVDEITSVLDTPNMIAAIKRRWPFYSVFVYPDASGDNRKSQNASETDIALLRGAGFNVLNNAANPRVRDRVLSVNLQIKTGEGEGVRRLKVVIDKCPAFVEGLEKQAYTDKGEPDKTTGLDHAVDAGGYFICYRFPVKHGRVVKASVTGT